MMNKNFICFFLVLCALFVSSFLVSNNNEIEENPWLMQPWKNGDELSAAYKTNFKVLSDSLSIRQEYDSSAKVIILVDAWGLPLNENHFKADLIAFGKNEKRKVLVHPRSLNQNKHVEQTELKGLLDDGLFLFGGDSLEYGRKDYIPKLGFSRTVFCQKCPDGVMAKMLDSLLIMNPDQKLIAWTTQSSREGDAEQLRESLALIADLASKHPKVKFIVQGTHRPILGTPETRKKFYAHWVPVVVLN